jgi:hypothetical protein
LNHPKRFSIGDAIVNQSSIQKSVFSFQLFLAVSLIRFPTNLTGVPGRFSTRFWYHWKHDIFLFLLVFESSKS